MGYFVRGKDNVGIFVEDINPEGKKTLLFLHGWPGSHQLFEYQYNVLPELGYRCIGIDTRGFGRSDKPFSGYDYHTLADDVKHVIEALDLHDIVLIGHSTGGAIACRYMGRYQGDRVSQLVLVGAAVPSLIQRPNFPYGLHPDTVKQIMKDTCEDRPRMLRNFGDMFFYQHTSQAFADWFFQIGLQAAGYATAAIANTWLNEVLFEDVASIQVPTLIIHGIHDAVVPFSLGEIQQRLIRNAVLVPFEGSGHGSFYDQKDEFNTVLAKFIEG